MSAAGLVWSQTAVVTTHGWGVLIHSECGAQQVRGNGLQQPVEWLRAQLAEPTPMEQLLAPLPPARRAPVERLVQALTDRGAITTFPEEPSLDKPASVELVVGAHDFSRAAAHELGTLWQSSDIAYQCRDTAAESALPILDGTVQADGPAGQVTGFRLMLWDGQLWLGRFAGSEQERMTAAEEMTFHLLRSARKSDTGEAAVREHPWFPWLAQEVVQTHLSGAEGVTECVRLSVTPFAKHRHRLIQEQRVPSAAAITASATALVEAPAQDPTDPLIVSRRCAGLVDGVLSPVAPPEESELQQLPLQLSRCQVRLATVVLETVLGHGWTLEQARGRAVAAALMTHGVSRLDPLVHMHPLFAPTGHDTGAQSAVVLPREQIERALAEANAAVSLGATADHGAEVAATRLAAHLEMARGQRGMLSVDFPRTAQGADLLAIHQPCEELLVAVGLPFWLVAVQVAPGAVVMGVSAAHEEEAVHEAIRQALLHHQSRTAGNEAAAPRLYRRPPQAVYAPATQPPDTLQKTLQEHGTVLTVPLSNGPSFDAALPHKTLVVLVPGGA
ncbi:hypothetical protein [Kocuria rosea]|uniref:hypothetical protein n=1 Tax=Kocuria rosea TaxID=1275 RepID=UPI003017E680